jgi:hypothetical protein
MKYYVTEMTYLGDSDPSIEHPHYASISCDVIRTGPFRQGAWSGNTSKQSYPDFDSAVRASFHLFEEVCEVLPADNLHSVGKVIPTYYQD